MTDDQEQASKGRHESEPTLDGRRLGLDGLKLPEANGKTRLKRLLRRISEFLAGMYTGESCAGTPHSERKRIDRKKDTKQSALEDRRL